MPTRNFVNSRLALETSLPKICTPTTSYALHYPRIVELGEKQLESQFWTAGEMKVELDKIQLLYELTPEQRHAVLTVLRLFVHYELEVGTMWKRIAEIFPRPEVQEVSAIVEMIERAVHARFYDKVNKQFGLDTDEYYSSFTQDPVLNERAEWLGGLLADREDPILSTIIFSMTETVLLFSSFAILKSFQSNGYNLIPVIVRGTNQSAVDEDLHGCISAEIINQYYAELGTTLFEDHYRRAQVELALDQAIAHEDRVIDLAIPGDSLNGQKKEHYKQYVRKRGNIYLERIGLPARYEIGEDPISDWFEKNTYAYKMIDFFSAGMGMEYESSWDEAALVSAW